jgi:hypothetical protein|tara:strand:+ start:233 stop:565 length:333 start_codon:yes stop_codon:yes gene_type:complete
MINFFQNKNVDKIIDDITTEVHLGADIFLNWKFPKIVERGFTCQQCSKKKNIHVEYDITELRIIVEEVNTRLNPSNRDSYEVKHRVQKAVVEELNELNSLDYLVLCESCS